MHQFGGPFHRILGARRFPGGRAQPVGQRRVIVLIPEVGQCVLFHNVGIARPYFGDDVGSQALLIYADASHVPEEVPIELLVKILPSTTYAVFTFKGEQITSDWARMIYHEWMAGSGYQVAHKYSFQLYDQRFKGLENLDDSEIDVYVPVK